MRPIVILGTPRSFTSLTAGIFRDHGVWFGECRDYHEFAPTGACENLRMKRILKSFAGPIVSPGIECPPFPDFGEKIKAVMNDQEYDGGPCAFKHSAMYHAVWDFCKPYFICCRRGKEAVMASGKRSTMFAANGESWDRHQEVMDKVVGVNVYGDRYFEGDWSDLQTAFEFCGLEFDVNIAEKLLDHKHKHF